ncbi:MAG: hypothetical protein ACLUNZ_06105 [Evtepia sp.]
MVTNVSEVKSALTPVFDQYHISQAILFGSVAKGTAARRAIWTCWSKVTFVD